MRGDDEEEEPKKRTEKEGERDGGMIRFARRFARHLGRPAHAAPVIRTARKGFKAAQAVIIRSSASDDFYGAPGPVSDVHDCFDPHWTGAAFEVVDEVISEPQDYFYPQL